MFLCAMLFLLLFYGVKVLRTWIWNRHTRKLRQGTAQPLWTITEILEERYLVDWDGFVSVTKATLPDGQLILTRDIEGLSEEEKHLIVSEKEFKSMML